MKNDYIQKGIIFVCACFVRSILAYIFYGSIDVSAFISINAHTFNNTLVQHPFTIWCSFPVIPFYLWFCGFLSLHTTLPLAFCFKIIPIVFDSLIAVLLYDMIKKMYATHALGVGMLYALSPVALIITCIHGQWESLPLFFLLLALYVRTCFVQSYLSFFMYGSLFAFAFMLKPMPVIFSLFFFVPWASFKQHIGRGWLFLRWLMGLTLAVVLIGFFVLKTNKSLSLDLLARTLFSQAYVLLLLFVMCVGATVFLCVKAWRSFPDDFKHYLTMQAIAVAGLLTIVAVCFGCFVWYGLNVMRIIDKVLRYFNQGISVFGLPRAWPFDQGILALLLKNRIWMMGLIAFFAYLYYKGTLDIYHGILCSLMLIFGVSGLSPQYLLWAVPFLCITGFYKTLAVFNVVCTAFFILYYMNPMTNPEVPYQSMLSFAALKPFAWLMPPLVLTHARLLPIQHLLGNYILPFICLSVIGIVVVNLMRGHAQRVLCMQESFFKVTNMYLMIPLLLTAGIAVVMFLSNPVGWGQLFNSLVTRTFDLYETIIVHTARSGNYGLHHLFNISNLLLVLACGWSLYCWLLQSVKE